MDQITNKDQIKVNPSENTIPEQQQQQEIINKTNTDENPQSEVNEKQITNNENIIIVNHLNSDDNQQYDFNQKLQSQVNESQENQSLVTPERIYLLQNQLQQQQETTKELWDELQKIKTEQSSRKEFNSAKKQTQPEEQLEKLKLDNLNANSNKVITNRDKSAPSHQNQIEDVEVLKSSSVLYNKSGLKQSRFENEQSNQKNNDSQLSEHKYSILQRKIDLLEKENTNLLLENEIYRDKSEFYKNKLKSLEEENSHLNQMVENLQLQLNQSKLLTRSFLDKNESVAQQSQIALNTNNPSTLNNQLQSGPEDQLKQIVGQKRQDEYLQEGKTNNALQDQEMIQELCQIMCAKTKDELIAIAKKYEKCIRTIPKLEKFIRDVCSLVNQNENSITSLKNMNDVIPQLKQWVIEREQYKQIQNGIKNTGSSEQMREYKKLYDMFAKYFELKPDENALIKLNLILSQFCELNQFVRAVKQKLDLDPKSTNESVYKIIVDKLESQLKYKQFINAITNLTNISQLDKLYSYIEKIIQMYKTEKRKQNQ